MIFFFFFLFAVSILMFYILSGEDWPGFDVPAVRSESLWDSEYNPVTHRWPSSETPNTEVS